MIYREHRIRDVPIRTSLGRSAAEAPETSAQIRRRAEEAWRRSGSAMFFRDQLEAMPEHERAVIEGAARRIYGDRRSER